jgi:AbiJ-like protein
MYLDPEQQKRLLPLKERVTANFTSENWLDLGAGTGCLDIVQGHSRLLRSLSFADEDYPSHVMSVLLSMASRDSANLKRIDDYVSARFGHDGETVSSVEVGRRIYFTPSVFEAPAEAVDPSLVAVMMPFEEGLKPVYKAIKAAATAQGLKCKRVDDIWQHSTVIQDIFSLIFRSSIVVCDFTGKNPNVFYECGIAHTLGKHVVPIAQHASDVPFDLHHHRYLQYLNNVEGLDSLTEALFDRLATLTGKFGSTFSW